MSPYSSFVWEHVREFCSTCDESLDHLYFLRPYSRYVWEHVQQKCLVYKQALEQDSELQWMIIDCSQQNFVSQVRRITFAATVYHLWWSKNQQVLKKILHSPECMVHVILKDGRSLLIGWKNMNRKQENLQLCSEFDISLLH